MLFVNAKVFSKMVMPVTLPVIYYTCFTCNLCIYGKLSPLTHFELLERSRNHWNGTPERLEPNTGPVGNCLRNIHL